MSNGNLDPSPDPVSGEADADVGVVGEFGGHPRYADSGDWQHAVVAS